MAKRNLQFKGFKEAEKVLQALPGKLGEKKLEEILREGAKPLVTQAKQNASHSDVTGNLSRSVGILKGRGVLKGAGIYVGPRRGKGANEKGWHAHLLEYGVATHQIKPTKAHGILAFNGGFVSGAVSHPGHAAQPFLRPAWDQTNAAVLQKIGEGFKEVLLKDLKKR